MMDKEALSTVIFIAIVLALCYCAYIFGIQKSFHGDSSTGLYNSTKLKAQSQQVIEDTEQKRKDAMEDLQQKIRDQQQRF